MNRHLKDEAHEGENHAELEETDAEVGEELAEEQAPPLPRHRFLRALHDSRLHALRLSGADSWQRATPCAPFASVSFRLAVHRHSRFQQGQLASRSHSARLPHLPSQHLLFGVHLPARNHARYFLRHQLFHSRQLLHQHHPRHYSPRRRPCSSLARWPRPLCHGFAPPDRRRPALPEKGHHGVSHMRPILFFLRLRRILLNCPNKLRRLSVLSDL